MLSSNQWLRFSKDISGWLHNFFLPKQKRGEIPFIQWLYASWTQSHFYPSVCPSEVDNYLSVQVVDLRCQEVRLHTSGLGLVMVNLVCQLDGTWKCASRWGRVAEGEGPLLQWVVLSAGDSPKRRKSKESSAAFACWPSHLAVDASTLLLPSYFANFGMQPLWPSSAD